MDRLFALPHALEWLEIKTKPLFVFAAIALYAIAIFQTAQDINFFEQPDAFLLEALILLTIPFGVILLQELFELLTTISHNPLLSARRQFEIVVLVIIRSFFKNFAKVNAEVGHGVIETPITEAMLKVIAIILIVAMILVFKYYSQQQSLSSYQTENRRVNLVKQVIVLIFSVVVLFDLLLVDQSFEELRFISIIFTGLIIIDALFILVAIMSDLDFMEIAFESSLVISLIFARFPLFTSNSVAYSLSVVGVAFATASLYLLHRARLYDNDPHQRHGEESLHHA